MKIIPLFASIILLVTMQSHNAHAYIDPGSGSAIVSAIIGFFVAAGLVVKTYWYKLKTLFCGKKKPDSDNAS